MKQQAIITAVYDDGTADVVVERSSICGGDCSECNSCMYENTIKTRAKNEINAHPGQQVYVETSTGTMFKAAAAIYALPLLFFFVGYGVAALVKLTEGFCILAAFVFLCAGALVSHFILKAKQKKTPVSVHVTEFKTDDCPSCN